MKKMKKYNVVVKFYLDFKVEGKNKKQAISKVKEVIEKSTLLEKIKNDDETVSYYVKEQNNNE